MPELPEVETIKNQLSLAAVGKKISAVVVFDKKAFIGDPDKAVGKKVAFADRRAKVLQIVFGGNSALFMHFKMNGRLAWLEKSACPLPRFARVIISFAGGERLVFSDSRKFGWVKYVDDARKENENLAIEPFRDDFTLKNFSDVLSKTRRPVKVVLMDQKKIGGIGNIYANESLFEAGIDPRRAAQSLSVEETRKLWKAIQKILAHAIECKGSSGKDEWYRQLDGSLGCYQKHFKVYQREGDLCLICGSKIKRIVIGQRGTFYCPKCQIKK